MTKPRGAVIAGGGTGGHIVPSLEVARALLARGHPADSIELYGSRHGQEATVWPPLEFPFTLLPGRGIRRSLRPAALWVNAGAVLGLVWACVRALASFVAHRPRVVVVVGGYASFPAGLAAVVTRVPIVLVNTDAVPGAVNALLGRFAAANAVSFPGVDLPRTHVTGTPVRPELSNLDRSPSGRDAARTTLGLPPDRQTVVAFGGSLGARKVNTAIADLARTWSGRDDVSIYQVAGRRDFAQFQRSGVRNGDGDERLHYAVVEYEDRMPVVYGAADLAICRAGAMTVAELMVAGLPSVLVPLPGAPRDHQTRNAEALVQAGAAVLVPDAECTGDRLAAEVSSLLADTARLQSMSDAARALGHPDAADQVAALVDAHAR